MITREYLIEHYGGLALQHLADEDGEQRYVFAAIAEDGAEVRVIHPANIALWEDYVRYDKALSLVDDQGYRLCQVRINGLLEFEEVRSNVF